jgi:hypothetical protein
VQLDAALRRFRDPRDVLFLRAQYRDRPDYPFFGLGPDTTPATRSSYRQRALQLELGLAARLGGLSALSLTARYRRVDLGPGQPPSIESEHDVGDARLAPGFAHPYGLVATELALALDSRGADVQYTSWTGARLDLRGAFAVDPGQPERRFFVLRGELAGFVDLSGVGHVLGARVTTEMLERAGDAAVPIPELPALGGLELMRGFISGRFRGDSTLVATVDYRYPVWLHADATVFVEAGNAFGPHLEGFGPGRVHLAWGIGLRTHRSRSWSWDVLLAFGTSRLDGPSVGLEQVQLVLGLNRGF